VARITTFVTNPHIRGTKHDIRDESRGMPGDDARFGVDDPTGAHVRHVATCAANAALRGA